MMSRTKSGRAFFLAKDPASGDSWIVDVQDRLTARQYKKMAGDPELLRQMANHLAVSERRGRRLQIYVRAEVSLNGRPHAPLVYENHDLGSEPYSLSPAAWIRR